MSDHPRKVSINKYIIFLFGGIIAVVIFTGDVFWALFKEKRDWPDNTWDLLFLIILLIGVFGVVYGIVNINFTKKLNEYLSTPDYNIDYQQELYTYKIIGKKNAKIKNGAQKFEKYTDWKTELIKKHGTIKNNEDAYRYMIRLLRDKQYFKEMLCTIAVPIEVGILTVFYTADNLVNNTGSFIGIFISAVMSVIIMGIYYLQCNDEISFIIDFIEIIFPKQFEKSQGA